MLKYLSLELALTSTRRLDEFNGHWSDLLIEVKGLTAALLILFVCVKHERPALLCMPKIEIDRQYLSRFSSSQLTI